MIRTCIVPVVLLLAGCRTPPFETVPNSIPIPIPVGLSPPSGQANFWYSQSQYDNLKILHDMNPSRFNLDQLKLHGKQYTECNQNNAPVGRFKDYVLVGTGPDDLCGKSSGEWE